MDKPKDGRKRRRIGIILFLLALALAVNSAYLAAYATPNLFYVINALLHPVAGALVAVLLIIYLNRRRDYLASLSGRISAILLALATGFGVYLFIVGMTHPHRLALYLHVGVRSRIRRKKIPPIAHPTCR